MNVRAYNYFWRGSVITSKRKKIDFVHFSGDGRFAYLPAGKDKMHKASHKKRLLEMSGRFLCVRPCVQVEPLSC